MPSGVYKRTEKNIESLRGSNKWINEDASVVPFVRNTTNNYRDLIIIELSDRDGWSCHSCGSELDNTSATIDHIIPLSLGGSNRFNNVKLACRNCNFKKGAEIRTKRGWTKRTRRRKQ